MKYVVSENKYIYSFSKVIDYASHVLPDYLREHYSSCPFDVILDIVGIDHALYSNSPAYLTPSGLFCTIGIVEFGKPSLIINHILFFDLCFRLHSMVSNQENLTIVERDGCPRISWRCTSETRIRAPWNGSLAICCYETVS